MRTFKDIEKPEADLWEAADNLRANSKPTSSDYFMLCLRDAAQRRHLRASHPSLANGGLSG